jgi:hypothetical protein
LLCHKCPFSYRFKPLRCQSDCPTGKSASHATPASSDQATGSSRHRGSENSLISNFPLSASCQDWFSYAFTHQWLYQQNLQTFPKFHGSDSFLFDPTNESNLSTPNITKQLNSPYGELCCCCFSLVTWSKGTSPFACFLEIVP